MRRWEGWRRVRRHFLCFENIHFACLRINILYLGYGALDNSRERELGCLSRVKQETTDPVRTCISSHDLKKKKKSVGGVWLCMT